MAPRIVYDFACPKIGTYNIKLFRDVAQYAADYLEDHRVGGGATVVQARQPRQCKFSQNLALY